MRPKSSTLSQSTDKTAQLGSSSQVNAQALKGQPDILTCTLIFTV